MYPPPYLGLECTIEENRTTVKLRYLHCLAVVNANAERIEVL